MSTHGPLEELQPPRLTEPPSDFDATASPLVHVGPAASRPFLLVAGGLEVRGTERSGIDRVALGDTELLAGLRTDAGVGANFALAPAMYRRELVGARGSVLESALAVSGLDLLAVRWGPPPGGLAAWSLELALTLLPDQSSVSRAVGAMGLRARLGASTERTIDLVFHPEPAQLRVSDSGHGGLAVHARFAVTGPVTLLLSPGSTRDAPRVITAAPHLQAHRMRNTADASAEVTGTLQVETGVVELDSGVAWATHRLRAALAREAIRSHATPPSVVDALFWSGLGALAACDADGCLQAIAALRSTSEEVASPPPSGSDGALVTLLAAGATLLTGDHRPALAAEEALEGETLRRIRASSTRSEWALWRVALARLADALHRAAPEEQLERLRAEAGRSAGAPGPVRLPMVGGPEQRGAGLADVLPWLLEAGPFPGAPPRPEEHGPFVQAWARLRTGDVDGGYRAWGEALAAGLAEGPSGMASWDAPGAHGAPATASALACLGLGLLGIVPDAPSGRIRIGPSLPGHLRTFIARRIRVGDARIDLEYQRDARRHRFVLTPTEGRVPPLAVFTPTVAGGVAGGVHIDGRDVDLDWIRDGVRSRLQVQLSLDATRSVEFSTG